MATDSKSQPGARDELRDLVADCLARMEQEGPAALDAMCAEHPTRAAALREMVEQLRDVGLLTGGPEGAFPERLGEFRLLARLGGGGMGVVYLAEQAALRRQVALKLVRPELLYFTGARERFRREVEAVARLQHPGIVPVLTGGEEGGIPWFAMELVQGATLQEVLDHLAGSAPARLKGADLRAAVTAVMQARATGGAAEPAAGSASGEAASRLFGGAWVAACLSVARAVAEALQHAHERGVLHRDVKPSNIMVTPAGHVLLLDFGLAQAEGSTRVTRTGSHLGSLAWMSPEQVRGDHAAMDARSDVYSLGATLHELLALRSPFAGADDESTRRAILEGRCVPLRELNAAVSRDAETVCLKAMDLQPDRRYATAADFAQDLGNALALRPVRARRPGPLLKARRWAQRRPAAAASAALGAVLLIGGPLGYGLVQARAADKEKALNAQLGASNAELDRTLGTLQAANLALDGKRVELEAALGSEQQQRQRAEKAFDRTLAAVDEMLASVGADDLRDIPQFEPVRNHLLERALDFYRELEQERPGDADLQLEQARTHRSIADLLKELGRSDEAQALYGQSIDEMRALLHDGPGTADQRHAFASTLAQLAGLDYSEGRLDDAQAHWDEARAELERVVAAPPVAPLAVRDLAVCLEGLGLVAQSRGALEDAFAFYAAAAEVAAPLADDHPDAVEFASQRAVSLNKAALIRVDQGRADEAEPLFRDAWAATGTLLAAESPSRAVRNSAVECASNYGLLLLTRSDRALAESVLRRGFDVALQLSRDFPEEREYRKRCAIVGLNVVAELVNQSREADAEPIVRECVARLETLAAESPDRVDVAYYLGAACSAAAAVQLGLHQFAPAAESAQRGVTLLRGAHESMPAEPGLTAQYSAALSQRAEVEFASGEPARALQTVEQALALDARRADVLYQAAVTLARGTLATRDAKALPPAERDALLRRVEDLALATLRSAIAAGFTDIDALRTGEDFVLLRARPEFEDVLASRAQQ